jgi:4-methylaminobutanoate oxidase (formaldehyde-forming)
LTSAGWGYTVGRNIGYGYVRSPEGVPTDWLKAGRYELEVAAERVPAQIHLDALYDPSMSRIKA